MLRHKLIASLLALALAPALYSQVVSTAAPDPAQVAELVTANHILAEMGLLDGYGHVSVRDARNPNRYLLAKAIPAATVTAADIRLYDLDSNPITGTAAESFWERYIHGEIYKLRPDVTAIIHSHAPEVVAFSITGVPLRPVIHMAGFLPQQVRVYDNRTLFGQTDLLITSTQKGHALGESLGSDPIVLLRGHGTVVVASGLHVVVGRAFYMAVNARVEQQALALGGGVITGLTAEEAEKSATQDGFERTWTLWKSKLGEK